MEELQSVLLSTGQKQGLRVIQEVALPPSSCPARSFLSEGKIGEIAVRACRRRRKDLRHRVLYGVVNERRRVGLFMYIYVFFVGVNEGHKG